MIYNNMNIHVKVNMIIMARAESINVISMPMSQMDIAIKHKITTPKSSMCYDHSSIEKHKGKVSINRLIKCHICLNWVQVWPSTCLQWSRHFMDPTFARCVPTKWRNSLFVLFGENLIFRKRLGVATYFNFF